jgi:hypothetical protein
LALIKNFNVLSIFTFYQKMPGNPSYACIIFVSPAFYRIYLKTSPIMTVLDPSVAMRFITTYRQFLVTADDDLHGADPYSPVLQRMGRARRKLVEQSALMQHYLEKAAQDETYDKDILQAIKTLKFGKWIYLRDTRSYSIFIDANGSCAYAVLGLTDRIRDIIGGSGVIFETGIVELADRYVCDGIIANPVVLGKNYLKSFNETLADLRSQNRFRVRPSIAGLSA